MTVSIAYSPSHTNVCNFFKSKVTFSGLNNISLNELCNSGAGINYLCSVIFRGINFSRRFGEGSIYLMRILSFKMAESFHL